MGGDRERTTEAETPNSEDFEDGATDIASNVTKAKKKSMFRMKVPKALKGSSSKSHASKHTAEFDDLSAQLEATNEQLKILINEVDQWERKYNEEVHEREAIIEREVARLQLPPPAAPDKAAEELEQAHLKSQSLQKQLATTAAQLKLRQEECRAWSEQAGELEQTNEDLRAQIDNLEKQQVPREERDRLEARSSQLQTEIKSLYTRTAELQARERENLAANAKLIRANEELNQQLLAATEGQKLLKSKLDEQALEKEQLLQRCRRSENDASAHADELDRASAETAELTQKLKRLQAQYTAEVQESATLVEKLRADNKRLEELSHSAKTELRSKEIAESEAIEELQTELSDLAQRLAREELARNTLLKEKEMAVHQRDQQAEKVTEQTAEALAMREKYRQLQEKLAQAEIENRSLMQATDRSEDVELLRTQNVQLEISVHTLQAEAVALKKDLDSERAQREQIIADAQAHAQKTVASKEQLEKEVRALKGENQELAEKLKSREAEHKQETKTLSETLATKTRELQQSQQQAEEFLSSSRKAKEDLKAVGDEADRLARANAELTAKMKRLSQDRQKELDALTERKSTVDEKMNKLQQELQAARNETREQSLKTDELAKQLETAGRRERELLAQLESAEAEYRQKLTDSAGELAALQTMLAEGNKGTDTAKKQLADALRRSEGLKKELSAVREEVRELTDKLNEMTRKCTAARQGEEEAKRAIAELKSAKSTLLADLESKLAKLTTEHSALQADLDRERQEHARLRKECEALRAELKSAQAELQSALADSERHRSELQTARAEQGKSKSELSECMDRYREEIETLKNAQKASEMAKREAVESLTEQKEGLVGEVNKLMSKLKSEVAASSELKTELVEMAVRLSDLESKNSELSRKEIRLEREVAALRHSEAELNDAQQKLKARCEVLTREAEQVPRLQDALTEQANICDSLRADLDESAERLRDFDGLNAALLKREEDLMKDTAQLTDTNAELLSKLNMLRTQSAGHSNTTAELNEALNDMQQQNQSLKKRKQELIAENSSLQDRLHQLETDLARIKDRAERFGEENRNLKEQLMKSEVQLRTHRHFEAGDGSDCEISESGVPGPESEIVNLRSRNVQLEMEVRNLLEKSRKLETDGEELRGRIVELELASKTNPPAVVYSNVIANVGNDQCGLVTTPEGPHEVVWCLKDRLVESLFDSSGAVRPATSNAFLNGAAPTSHNVFDPSHPQLSMKAVDDRPEVARVLARVRSLWKLGEDLRLALVQGDPYLAASYQETTTTHADWNSTLATLRGSAEVIAKRNAELERVAVEYSTGLQEARQIAKTDRERAKAIVQSLKSKLESLQEQRNRLQTERDHLLEEMRRLENQVHFLTTKAISSAGAGGLPAAHATAAPVLR